MQKTLEKIKQTFPWTASFLSVQFVVFLGVGVVNTFSTAMFAALLDFGVSTFNWQDPYQLTFVLGYCMSLVLSFFLNSWLTFRKKPTWQRFFRFPVGYIPNFIIQYVVVWALGQFGLGNTLSYLIAAVLGIPVTFLTMKSFVFRK